MIYIIWRIVFYMYICMYVTQWYVHFIFIHSKWNTFASFRNFPGRWIWKKEVLLTWNQQNIQLDSVVASAWRSSNSWIRNRYAGSVHVFPRQILSFMFFSRKLFFRSLENCVREIVRCFMKTLGPFKNQPEWENWTCSTSTPITKKR